MYSLELLGFSIVFEEGWRSDGDSKWLLNMTGMISMQSGHLHRYVTMKEDQDHDP